MAHSSPVRFCVCTGPSPQLRPSSHHRSKRVRTVALEPSPGCMYLHLDTSSGTMESWSHLKPGAFLTPHTTVLPLLAPWLLHNYLCCMWGYQHGSEGAGAITDWTLETLLLHMCLYVWQFTQQMSVLLPLQVALMPGPKNPEPQLPCWERNKDLEELSSHCHRSSPNPPHFWGHAHHWLLRILDIFITITWNFSVKEGRML